MAPHLALLAERLITDKVLQAYTAVASQDKASHGLVMAAGAFSAVGLGFMLYAAHLWLQDNFRPDQAAALTGLVAMSIGLVIALSYLALMHYKRSVVKTIQHDIRETVQEAVESFDDLLREPVQKKPKTSVAAASVAGFMAGEKLM